MKDGDILLKGLKPLLDTCLVSNLGVEILAVWGSLHSNAEDSLNHEVVVLLKSPIVGVLERSSEFFSWVIEVVTDTSGSEVKTSEQPNETFSSVLLLLGPLCKNEFLESSGFLLCGVVTLLEFGNVSIQIRLDRAEGGRT